MWAALWAASHVGVAGLQIKIKNLWSCSSHMSAAKSAAFISCRGSLTPPISMRIIPLHQYSLKICERGWIDDDMVSIPVWFNIYSDNGGTISSSSNKNQTDPPTHVFENYLGNIISYIYNKGWKSMTSVPLKKLLQTNVLKTEPFVEP